MYYKIIILFVLLFQNGCRPQEKKADAKMENKIAIKEVLFYSRSYGLVNPNTISKKSRISINKNKIYEFYQEYRDTVLIKTDTTQIIEASPKSKAVLSDIPDKYLQKNQVFGSPNLVDEGSLGVTIKLMDDTSVFWELSYGKNEHPEDIKPFYEMFLEIKEQLKKMESQ